MKTQLAIFLGSLLFVFTSCNNQQTNGTEQTNETSVPSQSDQMKAAYQGIVKAFETGNTDELGNYVADNCVGHNDPPQGITSTGLQQLKDMIAMYYKSFSNIKMNYYNVVTEGDWLLAYGSWTATNTGEFMGMPATNKNVTDVEFVDMMRFENGKFAEHWGVEDNLGFMTQLGVIPQEGTPPSATSHDTYDWNASVTSDPDKIAKMKEAYNSVINMIQSGDLTNLDQYIAADMKEHAIIPGANLPGGIEGAKQAMTMYKQVYPDLKIKVDHVAAAGDVLMAYYTFEGTCSGSEPGLPKEATGKKVKASAVDVVKFNAEGKASDHWEVTDHYTEMIQLGVIPAPGSEGQAAN